MQSNCNWCEKSNGYGCILESLMRKYLSFKWDWFLLLSKIDLSLLFEIQDLPIESNKQ